MVLSTGASQVLHAAVITPVQEWVVPVFSLSQVLHAAVITPVHEWVVPVFSLSCGSVHIKCPTDLHLLPDFHRLILTSLNLDRQPEAHGTAWNRYRQ